MEKEEKDLTTRINLGGLTRLRRGITPLELDLFTEIEYEPRENNRKRLQSSLYYSFEY